MSESFIDRALTNLRATLSKKNSDYRIDGEFSTFEFAAKLIGDADVQSVIIAQMGIKLGRLKGLPNDPHNESRLDTFEDLAGYAVILYAHAISEGWTGNKQDWSEDDDYPDAGASTCADS